jgi:galactokinase
MDQSVSLMAQAGHALFLDCRSLETRLVSFDLAASGLELLVIDTTVRHAHATGEYASRRASCETAARAIGVPALRDATMPDLDGAASQMDEVSYRRARHIITENDRVLQTVDVLARQGPRHIGQMLTASHVSMRDDFEISCVELDLAVTAALGAGALGARMTGGGFGGAAIALVEKDRVTEVGSAVTEAFARAGYSPPVIFSVVPHEGARADLTF